MLFDNSNILYIKSVCRLSGITKSVNEYFERKLGAGNTGFVTLDAKCQMV